MRIPLIAAACLACATAMAQPASVQPPPTDGGLRIDWEVENRFRLFRNDADFRRLAAAHRNDGVLAAEHRLARLTDGRGWAKDVVTHLCVDASGKLLETCERGGTRENYLAPQDHPIVARLGGPVPAGATCNWSFDDGTLPIGQVSAPCGEPVRIRLRFGKPTIAAVGITRADGSVDNATLEIQVRDLLIAGLGDSVAAGEGNPDIAVALSDDAFCFRRFLGTGRNEYFRPSRVGFTGDRACDEVPSAADTTVAAEWAKRGARWMSAACHRSLYSYQLRAALTLAIENPQVAVTFLPLACSGATIEAGMLGAQRARECPLTGACPGSVAGQIAQLQDILGKAKRGLDLMLLTVGANDIRFSGLVADVIIQSGVERVLFGQGGLIVSVAAAQRSFEEKFPTGFARLRATLKPLVGGDLARVVYVAYGHPALNGDAVCPGGRAGLDIHPAFAADAARLKQVADFVQGRFLPRLKALARCEDGAACRDVQTERMTFVDTHQAAFASRGFCARVEDDPVFDRDCFLANGESFDPDPVAAALKPLACAHRPSEFRPYAPRARWIRTANDSYFTAMTFPRGLLQPGNLHDATWAALSAVYGGAIHPTAEGQAAMADAALPALRRLLDLPAPPSVTSEPLSAIPR
jgi:hypothetical protein